MHKHGRKNKRGIVLGIALLACSAPMLTTSLPLLLMTLTGTPIYQDDRLMTMTEALMSELPPLGIGLGLLIAGIIITSRETKRLKKEIPEVMPEVKQQVSEFKAAQQEQIKKNEALAQLPGVQAMQPKNDPASIRRLVFVSSLGLQVFIGIIAAAFTYLDASTSTRVAAILVGSLFAMPTLTFIPLLRKTHVVLQGKEKSTIRLVSIADAKREMYLAKVAAGEIRPSTVDLSKGEVNAVQQGADN